jgi:PAS domain-containing protein
MTQHHARPRRTHAGVLAAIVLAVCTAACGSGEPSMNDAFTELMKRPDIEQAVSTYAEMTTKIRERLTSDFGRTWEQRSDGGGGGCESEFPGVNADGETRNLPRWSSPGNLPDEQWSRAEGLVGEIAASYGFHVKPEIIVDRPGDHEVVYRKPDGALITFGTAVNTPLDVETGCHLTAEAHQRGKPASGQR